MSTDENDFAGVAWLEPWTLIDAPEREAFERELLRELLPGHVLFGRTARAIARCTDRDDALFIVDGPRQLAVVHLTYSRATSGDRPHAMIFETVSDFVEGCLSPDHAEFADDGESD